MRDLTKAEVQVIRAMLAAEPISERERARRTGLPVRTYQTARRRILAAGWVVDRFVPNPIRLGRPFLRFDLVQPFVEQFDQVAQGIRNTPGVVVLWQSRQFLLALSLEGPAEGRVSPEVAENTPAGRHFSMRLDLRQPTCPVFFDFGGAWEHWTGGAPQGDYPQSLPKDRDRPEDAAATQNELKAIRELVSAPADAASEDGPIRRLLTPSRARSARYLEDAGLVDRRSFLNPPELPGFDGRQLAEFVYIHGNLRSDRPADLLFRTLIHATGVSPFLFLTDGQAVFLGSVSLEGPRSRSSREAPGPSVSGTLGRFLEKIEVLRDPVRGVVSIVNHRYDRLAAP